VNRAHAELSPSVWLVAGKGASEVASIASVDKAAHGRYRRPDIGESGASVAGKLRRYNDDSDGVLHQISRKVLFHLLSHITLVSLGFVAWLFLEHEKQQH
jgi:hypothetical protein